MSTAQDAADRSVITSSNDTSSAVYQPSSNYTVSNQNNTDSQNSTFIVRQSNGATYISPRIVDPSWVELKIGVLLPFHQQGNYWTKELTLSGTSAIRMAADEINSQQLIPGAYITLVEKDSYPKEVDGQAAITQAVFSAVSLIQDGVIGVIGDISSSWTSLSALMTSTLQIPQCSFTAVATSLSDKSQYAYFFRTVPTKLLFADAALSFSVSQGWPLLGILYSYDDTGQQLSENLIMKSKMKGIHVKAYQKFYEQGPKSDIQGAISTLMDTGVQIIFLAAEGDAQLAALTVAAHMGHINNNTVWMTMGSITDDLFSAVSEFNLALSNRTTQDGSSESVLNATLIGSSDNTTDYNHDNRTTAIEYAASITDNLTPIDFNRTFSGGVFSFEPMLDIPGYPPYDSFVEKWSKLDPNIYPYAGQNHITSNEGLAYSCLMVMAYGFNQVINNSTNSTYTRQQLADGRMGEYLTPSTFNTSFVGPAGPMLLDQNGDTLYGNFKLYNIQNGNEVVIGNLVAGDLTLTSAPIYHDGTTVPPSGVPTQVHLSLGYNSPISIVIASVAALGTLMAMAIMAIVLIYRKHEVFKASSPLFCVLELLGFILCYAAVFCYTADRSKFICIMIPTTFHLGFSLVLANLIAKNYRIYRIFNNIFITKTVVTDRQLLKVSGAILSVDAIFLISWLCASNIVPVKVPVSFSAYYVSCSYQGSATSVLVSLLTVVAAAQLAFATFLAIKTRTVGKNYSKYSEYRQIGISVYNIFFSALIGFVVYSVPTTDYYTRHYLTATTVVWAATFSLLVLFLPKLHVFFFKRDKDDQPGKRSDLTGRLRSNMAGNYGRTETTTQRELISLNGMLANPSVFDPAFNLKHGAEQQYPSTRTVLEAHEARMPVQVVFKYLPLLAAWDMKQIFLFPRLRYFSFISEKSQKGQVFAYTGASIVSSAQGTHIFRVHGSGWHDVLIQVGSRQDLENWCSYFNNGSSDASFSNGSFLSSSSNTYLTSPTTSTNRPHGDSATINPDDDDDDEPYLLSPTRTARAYSNDSGMTTARRLLTRQGSAATVDTMDSCLNAPIVTESNSLHSGYTVPSMPDLASLAPYRRRSDITPANQNVELFVPSSSTDDIFLQDMSKRQ